MIPTFRVIVKEIANKRHVIDYRYVSNLSIAQDGTVSITYYNDDFSNYDNDTLDINEYALHGVPNRTSAAGVRFTEKPLPTIKSLLPKITYSIKYPAKIVISVPVPDITPPTITIST